MRLGLLISVSANELGQQGEVGSGGVRRGEPMLLGPSQRAKLSRVGADDG